MNKRNKNKVVSRPFPYHNNITVFYEWNIGKDIILPGDKILFKNVRGKFTYIKTVENRDKNVVWIDCIEDKTKTFRSFYADKLKLKVKPKKFRKKIV